MNFPRIHTLDSWNAYRDYRFLWVGNFFANNAQWLQLLTIGWLVRDLTAGSPSSSLLAVTVGGINLVPSLVVGPWGGVLGDRVNRRKLIMAIQSFMAVLAFAFALLVLADIVQVWHAYVYVLISGSCLSVTQPMRQTLIANTVPLHAVGNAYAANVLTIPGTRMIGPFIGGVLIATLGFFWNFTVEALLYIAMVLVFLPMRTPYYRPRQISEQQSLTADLKDGMRYIWRDNRNILALTVLSLVPNVILQPVMFMLPVFTDEILHRGADVGGFLLATNGFGGLLAALIIASLGFMFKKGTMCMATVLISSLVAIVFAHSQWLPVAFVVIALFAFSQTTFRTANGTLIQTLAPDHLRGRVTSLQRYGQGFVVLTSLLIGWFAGYATPSIALTVVGVVGVILGLGFLLMAPHIRDLD